MEEIIFNPYKFELYICFVSDSVLDSFLNELIYCLHCTWWNKPYYLNYINDHKLNSYCGAFEYVMLIKQGKHASFVACRNITQCYILMDRFTVESKFAGVFSI